MSFFPLSSGGGALRVLLVDCETVENMNTLFPGDSCCVGPSAVIRTGNHDSVYICTRTEKKPTKEIGARAQTGL